MAQAPESISPACCVDPTSLDPEETTQQHPIRHSYRSRLLSTCLPEYAATRALYWKLDARDCSHRTVDLAMCRENAYFSVERATRRVVVLSDSCRLRWCPLCSRARSANISAAVTDWLRSHPRPKMLTLTLLHSNETIAAQITRLYACYVALRRFAWWRRNVNGGIWFFQVTFSASSGTWHPHIHTLLDSQFLPHPLIKATWLKITGDSSIVDIRSIHKIKTAADYVARYSARPALLQHLAPNHRLDLADALHSRRLCGKFGTARSCDLTGRRPQQPGQFYEVIAWDTAVCKVTADPRLAILWDYYRTGEPLPADFDYEALRRHHSNGFTGVTLSPARPPPDPHFAFA